MSGGHFTLGYWNVTNFADDLRSELNNPEYQFDEEAVLLMKQFVVHLDDVIEAIKDIDYLYSGDISEPRLIHTLKKVLKANPLPPTYVWDNTMHNL